MILSDRCSLVARGIILLIPVILSYFFLYQMETMSFIEVSPDSYFPVQNLPYGVFSTNDNVSVDISFMLKLLSLSLYGLVT